MTRTERTRATPERLFVAPNPEADALLKAVDEINRRFGDRAVVLAAMGVPKRLEAVDDAVGERPQ